MRSYLKELRKKNNMSQKQVAKELDISESYYSLIENGERQQKMNVELIEKISTVFKVPVTAIIEFESAG